MSELVADEYRRRNHDILGKGWLIRGLDLIRGRTTAHRHGHHQCDAREDEGWGSVDA